MAEVLDFHEAEILDRGLRVEIVGDAAGTYDVPLLRRAVSNLIGNAARHATPGSTIILRIESDSGHVRLAIENRGSTIAPEALPRIFDRFFRVESSRTQAGASRQYGLGLAIVAAIARMHAGRPFATSARGVTVIGIELPNQKRETVYLRDLYDHTIQVIDTVEANRDMLAGLLDVLRNAAAERLFLITSRHVLCDEPGDHHPGRGTGRHQPDPGLQSGAGPGQRRYPAGARTTGRHRTTAGWPMAGTAQRTQGDQ